MAEEDEVKKYSAKAQLMDMITHACDFGYTTSHFETVKQWTYLLFEEFFEQGDLEKEKNLPVSFLCDRDTTQIAKAQPGFYGFVVLPLYKSMIECIPGAMEALDKIQANADKWKEY